VHAGRWHAKRSLMCFVSGFHSAFLMSVTFTGRLMHSIV